MFNTIKAWLLTKYAGIKKTAIKWTIITVVLLMALGATIYYFNKKSDSNKATSDASDVGAKEVTLTVYKTNEVTVYVPPAVTSSQTTVVSGTPAPTPSPATNPAPAQIPIAQTIAPEKGAVVDIGLPKNAISGFPSFVVQDNHGTINVGNFYGSDHKGNSGLPKGMPEKADRVVDFSNLEAPEGMTLATDEFVDSDEVIDIILPKKMKSTFWAYDGDIKVWGDTGSETPHWKKYDGVDKYRILRIQSCGNRIRLEFTFKNKTP